MLSGNRQLNNILYKDICNTKKKNRSTNNIKHIHFTFDNNFSLSLSNKYNVILNSSKSATNRIENEFSRKYHLREIAKYFDVFQKEKYKHYTNEYLSNLCEVLSHNSKQHTEKRKIHMPLQYSSSMGNINDSCDSKSTRNLQTNRRSSVSIIKLKPNRRSNSSDIDKYDVFTDEMSKSSKEDITRINNYKYKNYRIKSNLKEDDEEKDNIFNREDFYKYYDERMMNNYGKMFINLSKNVYFYKNKNSNHHTMLKFMKKRSSNYDNKYDPTTVKTYSEKKVIKIKNETYL